MSARVSPDSWGWRCPECGDGSEHSYDDQDDAERAAAQHDERQHR